MARQRSSAIAASRKTSVCRSTSTVVVARRHQRHVVEGRQEDAAVEREEMQVARRGRGRRRPRPPSGSRRRGGRTRIRPGSPAWTRATGSPCPDRRRDARRPSARRAGSSARRPRRSGHAPGSRASPPARGVAGQRPADATDVGVVASCDRGHAVGDLVGSGRTRRQGMPPAIGLPMVSMSGSRPWAAV